VTRHDVELANEFGLICSMHVGGGVPMVPDGFERLARTGLIGRNFNVVHGNDIKPEVIRSITERGGLFTVTAEIELQMGYGHPLTGILHELGSPVSIGTDVEAASRGDMFTAMRVTLQHERARAITHALRETGKRPDAMPVTCRQALEWTTVNGARMAGLDHVTGSLTPSKQADIVLLRADDIGMFPVRDAAASIVMQGGVANVDTVLIAGRVMKRNGKLLHPGLAELKAALRRSGDRILADFGYQASAA
jgi:5-methylthioadenosine/S-adenosylhomocysteine deaminase